MNTKEEPLLGLATTKELLVELKSRMQTDVYTETPSGTYWTRWIAQVCNTALYNLNDDTLGYRTVDA